ncbi:DUF6286 domain-containing protein [Streptosporangium saharense]|uniref:DUF6286 domain-containing protein n=1 Tax=Streptosporangium saharense TaxID=1706840 RepID=A0A7W7VLB1_9ACTN|nr:DUF6286 domain-containing protein [Streptosporangium saharense]MBB4914626.1 hypothetical protein [Streptosporangium saharense]
MSTLQDIMAGTGGGTTAGEHLHAVRRRSVRLLRPERNPAGLVAALLVSVTLSAAAGVTAGLTMGSPVGRVPYRRLAEGVGAARWSDPVVFAVALGAMALGIVLLALAALPGRTRLVPLESADSRMVIGLTRAGLRRTLRAAAESVDEVGKARVRLGSRDIEVTVFTDADRAGPLLRQVGTVVGDRLTALGAMCAGEVVVRLRRRGV